MYTILIIDDEPIVKLLSVLSFLGKNMVFLSAERLKRSGGDAIDSETSARCDHYRLKNAGNGWTGTNPYLEGKGYPGEILVLSNYEDFDSVRSALLLGAADYLLKIKIQPDNLLACLNKTTEKLQKKAGERSALNVNTSSNKTGLLLSFFQGEATLPAFLQAHSETDLSFMEKSCAICYVTFEKYLSNEAFSISGKLLCDMILDAVQGVLQPYILVLSDFSALVVFSQKELIISQVKVEQLIKKLYNRFTMYQSFAPDMPYQENLKNYEEARKIYQTFISNEGHYKGDVAKTLTYLEENYMHRLTLASISSNVNLSSSYLCRVFKSEVGTNITSYLNNLRYESGYYDKGR